MPIDADFIFFDAAGTLIRPAERIGTVYARTAASFGLDVSADIVERAFFRSWKDMPAPRYDGGPSEEVDWRWWYAMAGHTFRGAVPAWPDHFDFDGCFDALWAWYAQPAAWKLCDDVLPCLERLSETCIPLGVLSNFDGRLRPVLEGLGIASFFSLTVLSSEAGAVKPDPAIYRHALRLAGVAPGRCLMVGDDPVNDWQGAADAGLQVFKLDRPALGLDAL